MKLPSFLELKKSLKKSNLDTKPIKVGLLGDSATQWMGIALRGMGVTYRINIDLYEADYNQIEQEVYNQDSALYSHEPDFIIICQSSEKLESQFLGLANEKKRNFADNALAQIQNLIDCVQQRLPNTKIIFFNFPINFDLSLGHFALKTSLSFRYQLQRLNNSLLEFSHMIGNLFLFDIAGLQALYGVNQRIEPKFFIKSKQIFAIDFLPILAKHLLDIIGAVQGTHLKKCLIIDLDNTMWGGVIGDDGIEKIQIGDLGIGKAFTNLQKWAKDLKNRGIILCICSKNTESIAKEVFIKHPDMVLRLDDIAVFVANWENKADNIRHIQSILNIGFDSMVFLDDNPFERNLVRQELPKVTVPELPEDPTEYMSYLRTLNLFETAAVSEEDNKRTKRYQEEAQRTQSKAKFGSIDDYLKQLEMGANCIPFSKFSIPRIAQLTQRSNQFNLRTVRYTEQSIESMCFDEQKVTFQVSLEDKHGEYGLISVVIGEIQNQSLFIDTWIMSCRVLKRGVENYVLNKIVERSKDLGLNTVIGEYLPTPKNGIVADHYKNLGFSLNETNSQWELSISSYTEKQTFIKSISYDNVG